MLINNLDRLQVPRTRTLNTLWCWMNLSLPNIRRILSYKLLLLYYNYTYKNLLRYLRVIDVGRLFSICKIIGELIGFKDRILQRHKIQVPKPGRNFWRFNPPLKSQKYYFCLKLKMMYIIICFICISII